MPLNDDDALHRYQCEVRFVCSLGGRANSYLMDVEKRRGEKSTEGLRNDAREQYRLGNRGKWGDWRTE